MKDRIIKFIQKEGISAAHFADEIGVQRSSVSHIISGRNNPSFDFIQKILQRYTSLNAEWLITGEGDIYKKNEKNIIIMPDNKSRDLPQGVQKDLFSTLPAEGASQISNTQKPAGSVVQPPQTAPLNPPAPEIRQTPVNETPAKTVEKIIIFYSDKTYTEFKPSS